MKKRLLFVILVAFCFMLILLYNNTVSAADYLESEAPEYVQEINSVFCKGTSVTIEERTDGENGAVIKWGENEILVPELTTVYGGGHEHEGKYKNASIVINGGTVENIWGGGLHKSYVENVTIELRNGRIIGGIMGGGAASNSPGCHKPYYQFASGKEGATTVVDNANIVIDGGSIFTLYGGAEGCRIC